MFHVSAQSVDERMINVPYYYYADCGLWREVVRHCCLHQEGGEICGLSNVTDLGFLRPPTKDGSVLYAHF